METFWRTFPGSLERRAKPRAHSAERDIDPDMVIASRFCAGLFGTQLLCATWLLFVYGVDIGVITPIGMAGSLFTLYCIVGTGRAKTTMDSRRRTSAVIDIARTLWAWSTKFSAPHLDDQTAVQAPAAARTRSRTKNGA
jgi:hypothetical protein